MAALTITARFLQPFSHGRGEDGRPEWPPSPLRLFQALASSAIGFTPDLVLRERYAASLRWLEQLSPPEIVAPPAAPMRGYRLFVPDNVADKVARSWAAGRSADVADFRTEKEVVPLRLQGEAVHYVFREPPQLAEHAETIRMAARRMTHLGWGIDQVAGEASTDEQPLVGEHWLPGRRGGGALRWAIPGTLDALERKHAQFVRRLEGNLFRPVSPLTVLTSCPYARTTDPERRPMAAFRLIHPDTGRLLWLEPRRHARNVAAWLRHAVGDISSGWPYGASDLVVHGHESTENGPTQKPHARFSYLPLPSITPRGAGSIARVLVVGSPELEAEIAWIRPRLAGLEVCWRGVPQAVLEPLPVLDNLSNGDAVLRSYVGITDEWDTVTPVVLPGHHDGSPSKAERLLLKAFSQAGLDASLISTIRELEWREVGFRSGVDRARAYSLPDKVRGPLFHVRVRFASRIAGPLAIGPGRHRGLGIFAAS